MIRNKLANFQVALQMWDSGRKRRAFKEISRGMSIIGALQEHETGEHIEQVKRVQLEVKRSPAEEDTRQKQRSKKHWLRSVDRNTKFFHMQANQKRKTNAIKSIMDENGAEVTKQIQIGEAFTDFFSLLFISSNPTEFECCLLGLQPKVTHDMDVHLMNQFTEEKVRQVAVQMNPLGSPEPDRL